MLRPHPLLSMEQLLEGRLFSEGLHVLGAAPSTAALEQYLSAYFSGGLPAEAVQAVAAVFHKVAQAVVVLVPWVAQCL